MKIFRLLTPVIIFSSVWILVIFLLSFKFSYLLKEKTSDAWTFFFWIITFFILGYMFFFLFRPKVYTEYKWPGTDEKTLKSFNGFVIFWISMTILEVIFSGGLPIIWLLTGSSKTYFDFGIPSVHGFLNALELTLGQLSFYFFYKTRKKKYLMFAIMFILWNVAIFTRQVIIVLVIEMFFIFFVISKNKIKIIRTLLIYGLFFILAFGWVGDFRSGADNFISVAVPSDNWPLWLPSGFLWVYIYITTPLNNLIYNFHFPVTDPDYLFPNTLSLLLPSVIRNLIYHNQDTVSGNLVSEAFNVSTAFMSSYKDIGYAGLMVFSFVIGLISNITWWVRGPKRLFFRAITAQCLILSVFYNHFFYLPIACQFIWLVIFFKKNKQNASEI
jgi:oligosaccharide repeat unit polymerase